MGLGGGPEGAPGGREAEDQRSQLVSGPKAHVLLRCQDFTYCSSSWVSCMGVPLDGASAGSKSRG